MAHPCLRFLWFLACCPVLLTAQDTDTLLRQLAPPVLVRDLRLQQATPGQRTENLDSISWQYTGQRRLDELLAGHLSLHLKDYGPGRLTTSTLRGANAAQTAVLWNGIPLQNPMLGQVDLSLLPMAFFDRVSLQYGAGSSLWGSGAMSGAIQLETQALQSPGWQAAWGGGAGSFGRLSQHLKVGWGGNKLSLGLRGFYEQADNDFNYTNLLGERKRLTNAALRQQGLLPSAHLRLGERHTLALHGWWQSSARELPPTRGQARSAAVQHDLSRRALLRWEYRRPGTVAQVRAAWLLEALDYQDSTADIFSESLARTLILETEASRQLGRGQRLMGGLSYHHTTAATNNYARPQAQRRPAAWAAWHLRDARDRRLALSLRQELADGQWLAPAPALDWQWPLSPAWLLKGQLSANYRLPTFNDRYWVPGGNPALKPERARSAEAGLHGQGRWQGLELEGSATLYTRSTQDFILWIPAGTVFSPENVRQVWSRGLELRGQLKWSALGCEWQAQAAYDHNRATNEKAQPGGTAILGKQLIYVPLHQGLASIRLSRGAWQGHYMHRIASKSFILADNSEHLPAYHSANAGLHYTLSLFSRPLTLGFMAYNLWGADYELVKNFPLPGRHFSVNVHLRWP